MATLITLLCSQIVHRRSRLRGLDRPDAHGFRRIWSLDQGLCSGLQRGAKWLAGYRQSRVMNTISFFSA